MRKFKLHWLFILLLSSLLIGCSGPDAVDIYGRPISMSNYKGRWVVITYWTTWCADCVNEIGELIKLKSLYPQVVILGINPDNLDNKVLQDLVQEYNFNFDVLSKFPIEDWGGKTPSQLPTTFIFTPKGELYQTLLGPQNLANFQSIMNLGPPVYK